MTRLVAFYLPQFHEIPENNEWWGDGFTEWVNVRRAQPVFLGHSHPRMPAELGEYNLLEADVHRAQTELARSHGVDGFCMYFYWFDGVRLLEKPTDAWRDDSSLLPYCLSWANESWTRRWDGKDQEVLMPQNYDDGFERELFASLLPHFGAAHYMRQDGKPILLVHRANLIPSPVSFSVRMRRYAEESGLPGLYLVGAETTPGLRPEKLGFDAIAEFPPVGANTLGVAQVAPLRGVSRAFQGRLMSYPRLARKFRGRAIPDFVRHRGVAPGWDNSARRGTKATIYVGNSPKEFSDWVRFAWRSERAQRGERGLVFINAWNEWAEGAYLEPDSESGRAYLRALTSSEVNDAGASLPIGRVWSLPQIRSLALAAAGTVLARWRAAANNINRFRR